MTPAKRRALGIVRAHRAFPKYARVGASRDDTIALQTRVADLSTQIAVVVEGCKSKLDALMLVLWDNLAKRMLAFASADPSTANYAVGTALLTEANGYSAKLAAAGCSNAPPPVPVPAPPPTSPSTGPLGDISDIVKWAAIALVAFALLGGGRGGRLL
jgi:hypothetical protein